jgi:hypothetical protein
MEIQNLHISDIESLVKELEAININKDEVKNKIIQNIYKKYDLNNPNLFFSDICQFFIQKIGYSNLNLPLETELRIKSYLQQRIYDKLDYNQTFNILTNEFYKSEEYHTFIDNFNKRVHRAFLLQNFKNKNDVIGFLNFCDLDELVLILR